MPTKFFSIHPAIGIARVGNADRSKKDFFFIGPEVPGIPANFDTSTGTFHSFKLDGHVRPQAVRFRIFEFERADDGRTKLIGEAKLNERGVSAISWNVHVANRKASFVKFNGPKGANALPLLFSDIEADQVRNDSVTGAAGRRRQLDLDPGPKSIAGGAAGKVDLSLPPGPLKLENIKTLGELRSDSAGRLIFIGGMGEAEKFRNAADPTHYANNDGWVDDVSDGPVSADVTVNGQVFSAQGAWVMTGPPDFVPAQRSYRTMYDTLGDLMARSAEAGGPFAALPPPLQRLRDIWASKDSPSPVQPSFTADIYPILRAMSRMDRVHSTTGEIFIGYHTSFTDSKFSKLGGKEFERSRAKSLFDRIRDPGKADSSTRQRMPRVYGNEALEPEPRLEAFHTVSPLQYHMLRLWSDGKARLDWTGSPPAASPQDITPDGLDEAALENVTGGPFYPGIEMSWLTAKPQAYAGPLRFALGRTVGSFEVPGTSDSVRSVVIEAGAFSQQMALPWHADFLACTKDEEAGGIVAWWPVQRPDDVILLGAENYVDWARIGPERKPMQKMRQMVDHWFTRGFVVQTNGDLFEVDGPDVPMA